MRIETEVVGVIVRRKPREAGTCHADLCGELVVVVNGTERAFCADHARERDLELSVRNAGGGTAEVIHLADWERDSITGRVQRRSE